MSQQLIVALIVVSAFGAGVFTGRATVDRPAAPAPVAAVAAPQPTAGEAPPSGTVAAVMQVPNYTYLQISTSNGDVWAAVSANPTLATGQKVRLVSASKMQGFTSKSLNRTFDEIWFGEVAVN